LLLKAVVLLFNSKLCFEQINKLPCLGWKCTWYTGNCSLIRRYYKKCNYTIEQFNQLNSDSTKHCLTFGHMLQSDCFNVHVLCFGLSSTKLSLMEKTQTCLYMPQAAEMISR